MDDPQLEKVREKIDKSLQMVNTVAGMTDQPSDVTMRAEKAVKLEEPEEEEANAEGRRQETLKQDIFFGNFFDIIDGAPPVDHSSSLQPPLFFPIPKLQEPKLEEPEEVAKIKENESEEAEAAEGIEVDTTSGKTGDTRKCQLCGSHVKSHASAHVACFHLKKNLFTCPVCIGFGNTLATEVSRHIKRIHPSNADEKPVSHVEEYSDEMQRLQAICFPQLQLKVSRPMKNNSPRETCMICNEKVSDPHRQNHVFLKHFKKASLFECPLCVASRPAFDALRQHIKKCHKNEYGKVQPISHEKEFEQEISALNAKCFPGWKRISSYGKKKRAAQKLKASCPPKNTRRRLTCMLCNEKVVCTHRQNHVFLKHFKKAKLFECPFCDASTITLRAVREHIKKHHQMDYRKAQPISHEKEFEKEISALNEMCFPGWKRYSSYDKKKTAGQKEDSQSEEEEISSESELDSEKDSNGKRPLMKCAEEEDEEEMEEGEGRRKGRA